MTLQERAREAIESLRSDLVSLSHFIHAHPELGYEEYESSAVLANFIEGHGFSVERGAGGLPTAFRATKGTGDLHVVYCAE